MKKYNSQEILVWFMWEKHQYFKKHGHSSRYMNKKIEDVILKWDNKKADRTLHEVIKNLKKTAKKDSYICPFCINNRLKTHSCAKCEFAKYKGDCSDKNSIYRKITRNNNYCFIDMFGEKFLKHCKMKMKLMKEKSV